MRRPALSAYHWHHPDGRLTSAESNERLTEFVLRGLALRTGGR